MSDTSTITPSESPTSFSALPASAWQEPVANESSGAGSQPAETPAADATAAITPVSRDSAAPDATPREGAEGSQQTGPIPYERHKEILEGERKQRTELEAKWQRVAWAEELANAGRSAEQIREALNLFDGVDAHPSQFLAKFYELLESHPQYQTDVRSWAGRVLAGHRGAAEATSDPEPQPTYYEGTDPNTGQRIRVVTDEYRQAWQEWKTRQLDKSVDQKIAPLIQDKQQREQQAQTLAAANQLYRQEYDRTKLEIEELRKYPQFVANEKEIRAWMKEHGDKPTLHQAFVHILTSKVLPALSQTERTKTLAELRTQANASGMSSKAPAAATPGAAPKRFKDLPAEAWKD